MCQFRTFYHLGSERLRKDDRPLSPPWRAGHYRVVSFRVEPNIVPTAVLAPLQQVLRLGRLGCRGGFYPPYCYPPPYYFHYLGRPGAKCNLPGVGRMMSWRRLAAGKPFDGLVLIMIFEMFDLRFHEMTCNARYYPKKSAI